MKADPLLGFPLVRLPKKLSTVDTTEVRTTVINGTEVFPLVRLPKKLSTSPQRFFYRSGMGVSISSTSEEVVNSITLLPAPAVSEVSISSTSEEVVNHYS